MAATKLLVEFADRRARGVAQAQLDGEDDDLAESSGQPAPQRTPAEQETRVAARAKQLMCSMLNARTAAGRTPLLGIVGMEDEPFPPEVRCGVRLRATQLSLFFL